jgi:hypothetical protein
MMATVPLPVLAEATAPIAAWPHVRERQKLESVRVEDGTSEESEE